MKNDDKNAPGIAQVWNDLENDLTMNIRKSSREKKMNHESYALIVGDAHAGKTTFIHNLIGKEKKENGAIYLQPKPTVCYDYYCGRRQKSSQNLNFSLEKETVNIWEIGSGLCDVDLMHVPFYKKPRKRSTIAIIVDLSKPHNVLLSVQKFLNEIKKILKEDETHCQNLCNTKGGIKCILPITTLVIGSKYDKCRALEGKKRKILITALRFITNAHSATLMFTSSLEKDMREKCRSICKHYFFKESSKVITSKMATKDDGDDIKCFSDDSYNRIMMTGPSTMSRLVKIPSSLEGISRQVQDLVELSEKVFGKSDLNTSTLNLEDIEKKYPEAIVDETLNSLGGGLLR